MKKYLLTTVVVFFAFVIALNAQEEEKKKIHLKIIKEENGKVIEIDTVFEGTDYEGMHFYGDIDGKELNIDSILKELNIDHEGHKGMKYVSISEKDYSNDSLMNVWHTISSEVEGDSAKIKKMIFISEDGDKKLVECTEVNVFISTDAHAAHGEHFFVKSDGGDVKVIKGESGKSMVWTTNDEGDINIEEHDGVKVITITDKIHTNHSDNHITYTIDTNSEGDSTKIKKMIFISEDSDKKLVDCKEGNVMIYKTGDETFDIIKSEGGEHKIVKEVIINKDGNVEKTIEIHITDDGDHSIIKVKGDEGDLENIEENVRIYKYKTDDGNISITAEIDLEDDNKKIKKEFQKIKISPNPTDGKFKLEFELSNKESVIVKVNNEGGKSVYSKKVKKFSGSFSEEIDITKEEAGTYYILITQGDKIIEQMIQKK